MFYALIGVNRPWAPSTSTPWIFYREVPKVNRFSRSTLLTIACVTFLAVPGCGPFGYIKKTAKNATEAVARAKAEGAEELAPYEYWGSTAYLDQSKVMMGYSEYERSFDYGDRALQLAGEAERKAKRNEELGVADGLAETDDVDPDSADGVAGDDVSSDDKKDGGSK